MFEKLKKDLNAVMERDPAVHSPWEVYFCYPGFRAVRRHRRAHRAYKKGHFFIARWISARTKKLTGIDIHPGARIGEGFFIDHGDGVVIGETAVIGDNVTLYQGVTLGGTGKDTGKRHPTLGNNVMVGAGAKVLGPFRIGDNSKIAAGAVVLEEIPPDSTAVGIPARVVRRKGERTAPCADMDQVHIPDPVAQELCRMSVKLNHMQKELDALKAEKTETQEESQNKEGCQE